MTQTIVDVPFFHDRDAELVSELVPQLKPGFFPPEELVLHEGRVGNEMYMIAEGTVSIFSVKANGARILYILLLTTQHLKMNVCWLMHFLGPVLMEGTPLAELGKGDLFGEMALLLEEQNRCRSATVITTSYCDMYTLSRDALVSAMTMSPELLKDLLDLALDRQNAQDIRIEVRASLLVSFRCEVRLIVLDLTAI